MKNMFWGVAIICVGVLVLINSIFGISLPIFKVLFGLLLLYWGVKVIFGSFDMNFSFTGEKRSTDREAVFANSTFKYPNSSELNEDGDNEYVTVFGKAVLDLTGLAEAPEQAIQLITVFGNTEVIVNKGMPLVIESQTVMGESSLPDRNKNVFGEFTYRSPEAKDGVRPLVIKSQVVFGRLKLTEK